MMHRNSLLIWLAMGLHLLAEEPQFQGRSAEDWIEWGKRGDYRQQRQTIRAMPEIGAAAAPLVLRYLNQLDGAIRHTTNVSTAIGTITVETDTELSGYSYAYDMLGELGSEASEVLPEVIAKYSGLDRKFSWPLRLPGFVKVCRDHP